MPLAWVSRDKAFLGQGLEEGMLSAEKMHMMGLFTANIVGPAQQFKRAAIDGDAPTKLGENRRSGPSGQPENRQQEGLVLQVCSF